MKNIQTPNDSFISKLAAGIPTLSFEFFPPKNPAGWATLYSTLSEISKEFPDYVSVTYGAGGSTREKTVDLVARIQRELDIQSVAHLTCVGHSRKELEGILLSWQKSGVKTVLALRGDPPKGQPDFKPHPEGFAHATELIQFISNHFDFRIGCACYPEKHQEAKSMEDDIRYLKQKQDLGATFSVTQMFFCNDHFFRFRDLATKAGVTIPLVAGIMPVQSAKQMGRFRQLSACDFPAKLEQTMSDSALDKQASIGLDHAMEQCDELLREGVAGIHLYTLNKSSASVTLSHELRKLGHFASEAAA